MYYQVKRQIAIRLRHRSPPSEMLSPCPLWSESVQRTGRTSRGYYRKCYRVGIIAFHLKCTVRSDGVHICLVLFALEHGFPLLTIKSIKL
jgi:hypothetical protein